MVAAKSSKNPCKFVFDPLSKDFVISKPIQQKAYDESTIYDLERGNNLIITRKRDGWKLFAVKYNGAWKLYTDGMNEIDERLDHIKKELQKKPIPDKTILVGEGIVDTNGKDSIGGVNSFFHSKYERAMELQRASGFIRFMVFGIIFWGGEVHASTPYAELVDRITQTFRDDENNFVIPLSIMQTSYDVAKRIVLESKWEGLVLYARDFAGSFREDGGSPARPEGCYKWKPIFEDDFIVRRWIESEKIPGRLKEIVLLQIDPKTEKEFECGKVGSFSQKTRSILERSKYPLVVQVEFEDRFRSGKLRNARFLRIRPDKRIRDCIAP